MHPESRQGICLRWTEEDAKTRDEIASVKLRFCRKVLHVLVYFVTACGNLWEDAILRNAGGLAETPHPPSALNFPRTMWDSAGWWRHTMGQMIRYCSKKISNIQMIEPVPAGALLLTLATFFIQINWTKPFVEMGKRIPTWKGQMIFFILQLILLHTLVKWNP